MTLEELNDIAASIREMRGIGGYTTSIEGAILFACERIAELEAENAKLQRALDQATEYGGHDLADLLKYPNDVKDYPDLADWLREKEKRS